MWFLARMLFWLNVVIALLPVTPSRQETAASQVGAADALSAVTAAVTAEMVKSVRGVGDHWILKNNPMQSSRTYPILSDASVVLEDRTQITSEQVVQQLLAAEVQSPKTRSRHC